MKEIDPPQELFIEERSVNSGFPSGHPSRESLIGSRINHPNWDFHGEKKDLDSENVYVYKFSHIEIVRKKLEIVIEKPKRKQ